MAKKKPAPKKSALDPRGDKSKAGIGKKRKSSQVGKSQNPPKYKKTSSQTRTAKTPPKTTKTSKSPPIKAQKKAGSKPKAKPKAEKKAKPSTKPKGPASVNKPGMLARGGSAAVKGAKGRGLWGVAGALGAWAVSEALNFDPKVAREQLTRSGGPKKLSKRQRIVSQMQGKKPAKISTKGISSGTGKADDDSATIKQSKKATKPSERKTPTPAAKRRLAEAIHREDLASVKGAGKSSKLKPVDRGRALWVEPQRVQNPAKGTGEGPKKPKGRTVTANLDPTGRTIDNFLRGMFSFAGSLDKASDLQAPKSRQRKNQAKGFKQFMVK